MTRTQELGFVFGTAVLGWLAALALTGGWADPTIVFWAAVLTVGATAALYGGQRLRGRV